VTLLKKRNVHFGIKPLALMLSLSVFLSGCMSIKNELPNPDNPRLSFSTLDAKGPRPVERHFTTSGRATFWFFYLIPKNKLDGYELAERELHESEAVQSLKIVTKYDLIDFLVGFISIVFGTYRIDVEGDVVKV
jgi:hypothetical protein